MGMILDEERVAKKQISDVISKSDSLIFEKRIAHEWLTTETAARYLGISENALRIMVHRNQIRTHKFGRRLRFKACDLETLFVVKGV